MLSLTECVIDDLEQSKVAGCHTVHTEFHYHSLTEGGRHRAREGERQIQAYVRCLE